MSDPIETPNPSPAARDPFFVLRDCRDLMQRRLSDIARQAGVSSPQLLAAYARQIGEAHDELASSSRADGFEQTAGLTASRISLVGNDDLELEIRIGDIAGRLKDNEQIDHWRVQLRYKTLLNRPRMLIDNNPAGFEPISLGLWTLCKESRNTLDQNLALLSRMEEQLQLQLPDFYRELNELLEGHGVEPAQVELIQRERGPAQRAAEGGSALAPAPGTAGNNALAGLQLAMLQQSGGDASLRTSDAPGAQTGNFTLNAATLQMLNQLMERLRVFELQQETGLADFSFGMGSDVSQSTTDALPRVLKSKDIDLPLGKQATQALDTLSLIFETLFASPELPTAIKRILGRLQIPLLKVAILDAAFFADPNHPARRLINRMARAAIGLHPDAERDHPVCVFLAHLADVIRSTLESGDGQIAPQLAELDRFIEARDLAVQTSGQTYIALIQRHETQAAARLAAGDWLRKLRVTQSVPALDPFLATLWVPAMRDAWLDGGTSGTRWIDHEATIQNLLWSTRPVGSPEDRKKLLTLIPVLLRRINAEFDRMQIASEVRKPFLDTCFELQTAAMRGATTAAAPVTGPAIEALIAAALGGENDTPILEENGKLVQYLARPEAEQTRSRTSLPPCKPGDWLIFDLPEEAQLCGCCCGVLAPFGTVVLFNPEWAYALALAPAQLEPQLRDGRARLVTARALFDEAAQQALTQIAAG